MNDQEMIAIMAEVKAKMGYEVEAFEGDIPESMISELVGMMTNEIQKIGGKAYYEAEKVSI